MSHDETQPRLTRHQERPAWMRHFADPRGLLGAIIGLLMARKNAPFNRAAVDLLDLRADDDVLEIGFGPGTALAMLAERLPRGTVTGIDRSATMRRQAARRNRDLVAAGRVTLHEASAERIPLGDHSFDHVVAINNFHIWSDRNAALGQIRRVLRPGGTLLLAVRGAIDDAGKYTPPGLDDAAVQRATEELRAADFTDVAVERVTVGRELIAITGRAPANEM